MMIIMPDLTLINEYALPFINSYREYFAFRVYGNHSFNTNLMNDYIFINVCKIIDSPDCFQQLCEFWKIKVVLKNVELRKSYQVIETIASKFYIIISSNDFKFSLYDPSASCQCFEIKKTRTKMVAMVIQELDLPQS